MAADYKAGSDLLSRALDHAVRDEHLTFTEAMSVWHEALPGVLRAAIEMRRAEQGRV